MDFKVFEEKMYKLLSQYTIRRKQYYRFGKQKDEPCCNNSDGSTFCKNCKTITLHRYYNMSFVCADIQKRSITIREYVYREKTLEVKQELYFNLDKRAKNVICFRDQDGKKSNNLPYEFSCNFPEALENQLIYTKEIMLKELEKSDVWTKTGLKEYVLEVNNFSFHNIESYLKYYAKNKHNKKIELLVKSGHRSMACHYITSNEKLPFEHSIKEMYPFSKSVVKELIELEKNRYNCATKDYLNKLININQIELLDEKNFRQLVYITPNNNNRHSDLNNVLSLLKNSYKIKDLYEYCLRADDYQAIPISETLMLLKDYVDIAKDMDIKVNKYPSSLKKSHDLLAREYKIALDSKQQEIFRKRYEENKHLEYSDKNYSLILPQKAEDLIAEGKNLNHCVASYTKKVLERQCLILFLRKNDNIKESYFTIEYREQKIMQIRGFSNCNLTDNDAKIFIDKWYEKVTKNKKHIAA